MKQTERDSALPPLYSIRQVYIDTSEQLDQLAHACGELYSQTVVSYWRLVRKHHLWLAPKQLMRWHTRQREAAGL